MSKTDLTDKNVINVDFLSNFKNDYYDYGMDVIKNRALPDVRDGLKPVQRAILTEMLTSHITSKHKTVKVAKITGAVIGKWHPHGDISVEDALAAMAAPWKNPMPAIEIKGNGGSVYGDSHAAGRYIEAKLSPTGDSYGDNLKQGVVPYEPNFDETLMMPKVLPAQLPYLLINGGEGIAVGLSSSIPPHNPVEVIKAVIRYIKNPNLSTKQLMTTLKGPDFPTSAIITNKDDLTDIYEHGLGKIRIRGRMRYDKKSHSLHVYEIPYNFAGSMNNLVDEIAQSTMDTINSKGKRVSPKIKGVLDVKDHSGKDGIDIQIKLAKGANADRLTNELFAKTRLETTFKFDMSALNNKQQKRYSLKDYFKEYTAFQDEVITNEYTMRYQDLSKRLEIIKGMLILQTVINEVVAEARLSNGKKELEQVLMTGKPLKGTPIKMKKIVKTFKFSEIQANYISGLAIYRLNRVDYDALKAEGQQIIKELKQVQKVIDNKNERSKIIIDRLTNSLTKLKGKEFSRHTEITNLKPAQASKLELPEVNMFFTFDKYQYLHLSEKKFDNAIKTTNKRRIGFIDETGICYPLYLSETKPTPETGTLIDGLLQNKTPIIGFTNQIDEGGDVLYVFADGNCKLTNASNFMTKNKQHVIKSAKTKEKLVKVVDWPKDKTAVTINGETFSKDAFSVQKPSGHGKHMINAIIDNIVEIEFNNETNASKSIAKPKRKAKRDDLDGYVYFDTEPIAKFDWDAETPEENHLFAVKYSELLKHQYLFIHENGKAKIVNGSDFKVKSRRKEITADYPKALILKIIPITSESKFVITYADDTVKALSPKEIPVQGIRSQGVKIFEDSVKSIVDKPNTKLPLVGRNIKARSINDWEESL